MIDRLQFKEDYTGYLDHRRNHIYVYDLESKKLTQVTSGDYDDSSPAWSPDGTTIAFVSNRTEEPDANVNTDLWLVDADNIDKGKNLIQLTTSPGSRFFSNVASQWQIDRLRFGSRPQRPAITPRAILR